MTSKTTNKFSPEERGRAVRLVLDHKANFFPLDCLPADSDKDRLLDAHAAGLGE